MSKFRRQIAFSITAVLLALSLIAFTAIPTEALAKPAGSHHESNQGEVHKNGIVARILVAVRAHIIRPVTQVVTGGGSSPSSPVCH
jgi:hypothetical protein